MAAEDLLYMVMILCIAGFVGTGMYALIGLTSIAVVFLSSTFAGLMVVLVITSPKIVGEKNERR